MVPTPDLVDERNPWDTDQLSENHENDEKSMFVKSTQDIIIATCIRNSGHISENEMIVWR